MKTLLSIIISLLTGYIIGRYTRFRSKNYGVTKKMFLTLERGEIDRKIEIALDVEDYELAFFLKRKMDKLERRLKRIKKKEIKNGQSKKNRRL
tara:strand:+ start:593 stop:871 length:279 start_codon:yes stop_codon:yes gene_type:complete